MPPRSSRPARRGTPHVHIVGGGISGLTAALRLAERGYGVTVYEEKAELGGNVAGYASGHGRTRGRYDVYPHMYGTFYRNFWNLVERDLGLRRGPGGDFEPRYTFKVLDRGRFPRYIDLLNVGSPASVWTSLMAGVASPAELLLGGYSLIDGLSYSLEDDSILDRVSVEGFLRTRPYATNELSKLHDTIIMTIWSVHSDETSAAAYRRFIEHNVPMPVPLLWLLTGDLGTRLIEPLRRKIAQCGGTFRTNTRVLNVAVEPAGGARRPWRVTGLDVRPTRFDSRTRKWLNAGAARHVDVRHQAGDTVVLAVPPEALAYLIAPKESRPGHRIVDRLPNLSQVRRLQGEPIPVLNLYFKKKLRDIPKEHVLLRDSRYDLTLLDLSQIWHDDENMTYRGKDRTVLCVAASDYYALPSPNEAEERMRIIAEVHKYLPVFRPGRRWGDPASDIDWDLTHFDPNTDRMLFLNRVGGKQWQPETHYPNEIANLFFGGDCTINPVRMATVEAAIVSGLQAARGIWAKHPRGEPIDIQEAEALPLPAILAMKTLLAPWAYAAKCWSSASDLLPHLANGDAEAAGAALAVAVRDIYATPYQMAVDLWQGMVRAAADYGSRALEPVLRRRPR